MAESGCKQQPLTEEEIFEGLRDLNVPVRINDLKCPSKEFIVRIFECFLKDLRIDITRPELRPWESVNHIEDAEIYEDPQLLLLLASSVNYIIGLEGFDINIKDIVEPRPKRTKKILNYLLVLWNYYLQKYAKYRAIEESYEDKKKLLENLSHENVALDEKYEEMLSTLNKMKVDNELPNLVKVKEAKVEKLKAETESIQADYQGLKTKEVNLRNQLGALEVQIITSKERLDELSQLILSSPDRINTEIKNLEDRIKSEDSKIKECESRLKDTVKKVELQEECLKEEEKVLNALSEIWEINQNLKEIQKSLSDIYQKVNEEEDKVKRLEQDLDREEDVKYRHEQTSAKVALTTRKQVETLKEVLKMNQGLEAKDRKTLEFLKKAINNLKEDLDSESDNILQLIEKCKVADARSKERETVFRSKLKEESSRFKLDCKEVVDVIQSTFSNVPDKKH